MAIERKSVETPYSRDEAWELVQQAQSYYDVVLEASISKTHSYETANDAFSKAMDIYSHLMFREEIFEYGYDNVISLNADTITEHIGRVSVRGEKKPSFTKWGLLFMLVVAVVTILIKEFRGY